MNCLSAFEHFVVLVLKGLKIYVTCDQCCSKFTKSLSKFSNAVLDQFNNQKILEITFDKYFIKSPHDYHHHIRFNVSFLGNFVLHEFFLNDFQTCLSLVNFLIAFNSLRSLFVNSLIVYLGHYLAKLSPTLNSQQLLYQHLSSILSWWQNYKKLLFCQHYLLALNCSLFLRSTAEILCSGFTLHIHLIVLASFSLHKKWSFPLRI